MSPWMSSARFWVDVMNVGMALLVAVPLFFVAGAVVRELVSRRQARKRSLSSGGSR